MALDEFLEDLKSGEIQFRDRWQFELKSEFYPRSAFSENTFHQDFYFFIPNALQVNHNTYAKDQFYRDLTNFIRYKTPEFSLKELVREDNPLSPYVRLKNLTREVLGKKEIGQAENEIKLLGNIFRSALRNRVLTILTYAEKNDKLESDVLSFCHDIEKAIGEIRKLEMHFLTKNSSESLRMTWNYFDEFTGNTLDYFLTGLLDKLRHGEKPLAKEADERICELIIQEKVRRDSLYHRIVLAGPGGAGREQILYRSGLLKKFIIDPLILPIHRSSIQERYGQIIAGLSAGVAMLVYILLFVWFGQAFVVTSQPFIILTVITYILKDRLKEALKALSYERALKWFSDYTTEILTPSEDGILGELKESFTFVDEGDIPKEIAEIRNKEFHTVLEMFKRKEQVIYFKRSVTMYSLISEKQKRFNALNIILRFNIKDFTEKASDPYHSYVTLDSRTKTILRMRLPKVYHLNIILKNSFLDEKKKPVIEWRKFRLIIDKNGIKQIEQVRLPGA